MKWIWKIIPEAKVLGRIWCSNCIEKNSFRLDLNLVTSASLHGSMNLFNMIGFDGSIQSGDVSWTIGCQTASRVNAKSLLLSGFNLLWSRITSILLGLYAHPVHVHFHVVTSHVVTEWSTPAMSSMTEATSYNCAPIANARRLSGWRVTYTIAVVKNWLLNTA